MSYDIQATMQVKLDATSKADATTSPGSSSAGSSRLFDAYSKTLTFHSASKPPVSGRLIDISTTLAGASQDFDLTAAPSAEDLAELVSVNGLKLAGAIFWAPKSNGGNITLAQSVANGYPILGAVDLVLPPGTMLVLGLNGEADAAYVNPMQAVDATHKVVRVSGAAGRKLYALLMWGT